MSIEPLTRYSDTSNPKLNVPMTESQRDVIELLEFESQTGNAVYPFAVKFEDLDIETIARIADLCTDTEDEDQVYDACAHVLGHSDEFKKLLGKRRTSVRKHIREVFGDIFPGYADNILEKESQTEEKTYLDITADYLTHMLETGHRGRFTTEDIREAIATVILEHLD